MIALALGLGILATLCLVAVRRKGPRDIRQRVYHRQDGRCCDCQQAMDEAWLKLDESPDGQPEFVCSVCHMARHA